MPNLVKRLNAVASGMRLTRDRNLLTVKHLRMAKHHRSFACLPAMP